LLDMDQDPRGRDILRQLMIRRFVAVPDQLFDSIRQMLRVVDRDRARAAVPSAGPLR
jgi:hypothetical protein